MALANAYRVAVIVATSVLGVVWCTGFPPIPFHTQVTNVRDSQTTIDRNRALAIAREDAEHSYRDLSIYKVSAQLRDGKWYVDYNLTGAFAVGGGPHYVIAETTGEILERRYEQ